MAYENTIQVASQLIQIFAINAQNNEPSFGALTRSDFVIYLKYWELIVNPNIFFLLLDEF